MYWVREGPLSWILADEPIVGLAEKDDASAVNLDACWEKGNIIICS
jgi:hypothetical protein